MRIYLSGPMTGFPEFNYPLFNKVAQAWRTEGHYVLNPAEHFDGDYNHKGGRPAYLRADMTDLLEAEAIALLPGWENSSGAKLELAIARELGLHVLDARRPARLVDVQEHTFDSEPRVALLAWQHAADLLARLQGAEVQPVEPGPVMETTEQQEEWMAQEAEEQRHRPEVLDYSGEVDGGGYKASMDDPKKLPLWLVPNALINGAAAVLGYGASKYAPQNWRRGMAWSETYSALQRHLTAWNEGEDADPESGLPHLGHAACCLAFLLEYEAQPALYAKFDNRFKRQKVAVS